MSEARFETVIVSDLHLGSEVSRARDALQMLKSISFGRLILLGDIFCDLNFRRLKKEHWQFLGYIRKLSNPKRGVEVVWVEGNHDQGLTEVMSHLVGVRVYQEYTWEYKRLRHLAIHGHQFDGFVLGNFRLSKFCTQLYLQLQKLEGGQKRIARFFDGLDTRWLRLSHKVAEGALQHARSKQFDRVFCGHTHEASHYSREGVEYFNTGSWTQTRATFVTVDEEGVKIHEYSARAYDCDPREERGEADPFAADFTDLAGLPADLAYQGLRG